MSKIGRNDPCPCGSTRKYKLCCGAVRIAAVADPVASTRGSTSASTSSLRSCGTCTACCDGWLEGEVRGHRMHPGQPCHFVAKGACSIYAERPQSPCRSFVCGWVQPGSLLPEAYRPDRIGVIAVPTRWRNAPALILVSAGNDPGDDVLAWMHANTAERGTPFLYAVAGERFGHGPVEFQREMAERVARGEKLW